MKRFTPPRNSSLCGTLLWILFGGDVNQFAAVVASVAMVFAQFADGQAGPRFDLVGQVGGEPSALVVSGAIAYLAQGPRLLALDISDPAQPREVWRSAPHDARFTSLGLDGHRLAYTTAGQVGLFDVRDPTWPVEVSSYPLPSSGVTIAGDDLFVTGNPNTFGTSYEARLHVLDVADLTHPVEVAANAAPSLLDHASAVPGPALGPGGGDGGVVVAGTYAYLSGSDSGAPRSRGQVRVVDIANPLAPTQVGGITFAGDSAQPRIVPTADRVYALSTGYGWGGGHAWLTAFDRASGHLLAPPTDVGPAYGLAVDGTLAYLTTQQAGGQAALQVFDVHDVAHPVSLSSIAVESTGRGVVLAGQRVLVMTPTGFRVFDRTDPIHPRARGGYAAYTTASAPLVRDGMGYALGSAGSADADLIVFDLTDPSRPWPVARLKLPGARFVGLLGSTAVVSFFGSDAAHGGIYLVDVSNAWQPRQVGVFLTDAVWETAAQGTTVYLLAGEGTETVHVVDVSVPRQPKELGAFDVGHPQQIAVSGAYVYLLTGAPPADPVLQIYDVSDRSQARLIATRSSLQLHPSMGTIAWPTSLAITGTSMYVGGMGGLQVLDVSDPSQPHEVGVYRTTGAFGPVVAADRIVYGFDGVRLDAIDVTDPAHPTLIASEQRLTINQPEIAAAGDFVYLAGTTGLEVFRVRPPAGPPSSPPDEAVPSTL